MRYSRSKQAMGMLVCWLLFAVLELWVYLSGFHNQFAETQHLRWETYLSLTLFVSGGILGFLHLLQVERRQFLAGVWLLAGAFLFILPLVPLTPLRASDWHIEVYKLDRRLDLYHKDELKSSYRIGLGGHSEGDKEVMGDGKTPVGEFWICDKGPSQFHKWLGLNYPTPEDAWRGRREARITWPEFWYIRMENMNGKIPYGNSALGGAIGIHGGGSDNDWTLGCIALENDHVDEFFDQIPLGTRVQVFD